MVLKNSISDSAFMVNISRNKSISISQDIYSHLWIPDNQISSVENLWNKYSQQVYKFDDIELGIRTAYFLNILEKEIHKHADLVFINIASGFTSYQYLVKKDILTIEVDYEHMVLAKQGRAKILMNKNIIPERETIYFSCDLTNSNDRERIFQKMDDILNTRNALIFCEGLFYYLPISIVEKLLKNMSKLQQPGNSIAFDYWKPSLKWSKIYKGMIDFYLNEMDMHEKEISLFNPPEIINQVCFDILESTNVFEQELKLSKERVLQKNREICLEENYMKIMIKKACTQQWL